MKIITEYKKHSKRSAPHLYEENCQVDISLCNNSSPLEDFAHFLSVICDIILPFQIFFPHYFIFLVIIIYHHIFLNKCHPKEYWIQKVQNIHKIPQYNLVYFLFEVLVLSETGFVIFCYSLVTVFIILLWMAPC